MRWQWCLWRGRLRDSILPFFSDSQEKFLTHVGDEAVAERVLRVVTGFRGARMSRTADRLVFRSTYLWPLFPRYWRRKYVHIKNVTQYQAQFHSEMEHAMERYKERLWAYGLRVASAGAFTLATTGLVSSNSGPASPTHPATAVDTAPTDVPSSTAMVGHSKKRRSVSSWVQHAVVSLAPSFDDSVALATFFVFFFVLVKRRRVFIIDDVMRFGQPHGHRRHNVSLMLGDLKCFGQTYPLVLLSSNEGITHVFEDKSPSTYQHLAMPAATDEELYLAIQKSSGAFSPTPSLPSTSNSIEGQFSAVDVRRMRSVIGMEHHTSSVRWWMQISQMVGGNEASARALCSGHTTLSIAALQQIALYHDLQGDDVALSFSLAYSPPVDIRRSLAGYFPLAIAENVCAFFGTDSCPRRLLLAAALLVASQPPSCGNVVCLPTAGNALSLTTFATELHRILQPVLQGPHGEDVFQEDLTCRNALNAIRQRITDVLTLK